MLTLSMTNLILGLLFISHIVTADNSGDLLKVAATHNKLRTNKAAYIKELSPSLFPSDKVFLNQIFSEYPGVMPEVKASGEKLIFKVANKNHSFEIMTKKNFTYLIDGIPFKDEIFAPLKTRYQNLEATIAKKSMSWNFLFESTALAFGESHSTIGSFIALASTYVHQITDSSVLSLCENNSAFVSALVNDGVDVRNNILGQQRTYRLNELNAMFLDYFKYCDEADTREKNLNYCNDVSRNLQCAQTEIKGFIKKADEATSARLKANIQSTPWWAQGLITLKSYNQRFTKDIGTEPQGKTNEKDGSLK